MFSYYGSKSKVVKHYPRPKYDKIIEPFAGSARYSLLHWENDILLVDKYDVIVDVWNWLKQCNEHDILSLPKLKHGESIRQHAYLSEIEQHFLGFLICAGSTGGRKNVGSMKGINVENDLKRIAANIYKIKHWNIFCADYKIIYNQDATWFIDPPYQFGGHEYKHSNKNINFSELAHWCRTRKGQVIVCENTKADWMEFKPMRKMQGTAFKTTEAIWSNHRTDFDDVQMELFQSK